MAIRLPNGTIVDLFCSISLAYPGGKSKTLRKAGMRIGGGTTSWVKQGQLRGFRVGGRVMIPRDLVADYVRRARGSLGLEEVSDEEAAGLVAEGRRRG